LDDEGPKIELTIVGMLTLWTLSGVLLTWSTLRFGLEDNASRWAWFIALAAATWTILIGLARSRRRIIHAIRYELQLIREEEDRDRRRFEIV